ncbi:MAG: protein kinase [Chthoniobacterales bacterium]|nr:protein kinase [Chthoniobacterales bacterium]
MSHEVFISYCTEDEKIAESLCAALESAGIGCWIAPRDVRPGENWGRSIIKAIAGSKLMVLVFSGHTNSSRHVNNEIERAVSHRVTIMPFRIEKVQPSEDLELFISSCHWLDAYTPPMEPKIAQLVAAVRSVLGVEAALPGPAAGPAAPHTPSVATPTSELAFHHFVVLRHEDSTQWELGRGAMGVTYKAMDSRLRRMVALKVVSPELLATGSAREKFLLEAQATAALEHPNIASIYYFGEQDDSCFYAMEFVDGCTLEDLVRTQGPLNAEDALSVASQTAAALGAAHESGMIHRDIKPTNVMILRKSDGTLSVRVIDFGLAAAAGGEHANPDTFEGTPLYASPEQLDQTALDARSDVYSLGATLYFALAGKPPFEGTVAQIASRQIMQPFPAENLHDTPIEVVNLVAHLMHRDPGHRPQSGGDARSEIENILRDYQMAGQQTAAEWMAGRFHSINRIGPIEGGSLYRVASPSGDGELAVLCFDTSARGLAVADRVSELAPRISGLAAPAARRVFEMAEVKDGLVLVTEWLAGTRLLSVLRVRRTLRTDEAGLVLGPLAAALDEAANAGLPLPQLGLREILLQPPQKPEVHLDEWDGLRPVIDFLPVGEAVEADVNTTIVSTSALAQITSYEASTRSPAALIASLAYEVLGGMSAPGLGPYVPLAELSQDANAALREVFQNPHDETTATTLVLKILPPQRVGQSAAAQAQDASRAPKKKQPPPRPRQAPEKAAASPTTCAATEAKSKVPMIAGAAVLAVALAGGAFFALRGGEKEAGRPAGAKPLQNVAPSQQSTAKTTAAESGEDRNRMLAEAKSSEDRQDFIGAIAIYAQMIARDAGDNDAKSRAENAIARLEEKEDTLGSNQQSLEALRALAKAGLNRARIFLGFLLRDTDPKESIKLITSAAEQGDRRAMRLLGLRLAKGEGGTRADYSEAAPWLKKAADLGDSEAMLAYGECLEKGKGVAPDLVGAAELYSKAAALGVVPAKSKLAVFYRKGLGVPKVDQAEAFRLFQEATSAGFLEAQGNLGVMYANGESVPTDLAKAVALWKDGVEKGSDICMFFYAKSLEFGTLGNPDPVAAREWYIKSAHLGNPDATDWCTENGVDF